MRCAALLVLLAPAIAWGEPTLEGLTAGWPAEQQAQAQQAVQAAVDAGLARAAALDRIQEWQVKGADGARVVQLLVVLAHATADGREALVGAGVAPSSALVESAAAARLAGVSTQDLGRAVAGAPSSEEAQGRCLALSTLALSGFLPKASAEVVTLAAQRGYGRADLGAMVTTVQRLAREGVAPREALLGELGSAVRRGARAGELYPALVQALHAGRTGPEPGFNRGGPHGGR